MKPLRKNSKILKAQVNYSVDSPDSHKIKALTSLAHARSFHKNNRSKDGILSRSKAIRKTQTANNINLFGNLRKQSKQRFQLKKLQNARNLSLI